MLYGDLVSERCRIAAELPGFGGSLPGEGTTVLMALRQVWMAKATYCGDHVTKGRAGQS